MGYLSRSELISELKRIHTLYQNYLEIQKKIKNYRAPDRYERKIAVPPFPGKYKNDEERDKVLASINHTGKNADEDAIKKYTKACGPKQPRQPSKATFYEPNDEKAEKTQRRAGCFSYIFLFICIVFILNIFGYRNAAPEVIRIMQNCAYVSGGLFLLFLFIKYFSKFKAKWTNKRNYDKKEHEKTKDYEAKMAIYAKKAKAFEPVLSDFAVQYPKWRPIYLEHLKEEKAIAAKLERDTALGQEQIRQQELIPVENELEATVDIVAPKYRPALEQLITIIEDGRADSVKEAINVYKEDLHRQEQLRLAAAAEQQRRADEERRYQEDKRFHEAHEEWQRRNGQEQLDLLKQQKRDADLRYKEDKRAQQRAASSATRCGHCAHYSTCYVRRTSGASGCPGYTPR